MFTLQEGPEAGEVGKASGSTSGERNKHSSFADCSCEHLSAGAEEGAVEYTCGLFKLRLCRECGKLFADALK